MDGQQTDPIAVELSPEQYDLFTALVQYARQKHPDHLPERYEVDEDHPFDLGELDDLERVLCNAAPAGPDGGDADADR